MPTATLDYPKLRTTHTCPLCDMPKEPGLVTCWPCHRWAKRNAGTLVAQIAHDVLDRAERTAVPGHRPTEPGFWSR